MNDIMSETDTLLGGAVERPGDILRRAREGKGMTLGDVAEVTRVAQRQLEAIERSDFHSLPGTPYAVGFARAYARAVGADEVEIARSVRDELGAGEGGQHYEAFEPVDPARIPPRRLAWTAAFIGLVLAIGYGVWRTQFFAASTDQEISDLSNRASARPIAAASSPQQPVEPVVGPVVLTATDKVWLRIYDQAGERLLEKEMAKGESFTVPPGANNPMILTGRPDALSVTVGGKGVAPLGPPNRSIADVPVSAAALLARPPAPVASEASASAVASTQVPSAPVTQPASSAAASTPGSNGPRTAEHILPVQNNAAKPAITKPVAATVQPAAQGGAPAGAVAVPADPSAETDATTIN